MKLVRLSMDKTQQKLAVQLGISETKLSKIETGRQTPSQSLLAKIASILQMDPHEVLTDISAGERS